jgi:hypothetical protein
MLLVIPNDWRKLRRLITWILKANLATEIIRLNYLQSYTLSDQHIQKTEKKALFIKTSQQEKLKLFLQKNYPEAECHPDTISHCEQ